MLMPDPDRTKHGEYLNNYTSGGPAKIIGIGREVGGLRQDGTVFPLDLAISEVEGLDQRLFVGVVRDISERKAAERALVESEESFRSVVETMGEGLLVAAAGERFFANQAFMDIYGYKTLEEALNAPRFDGMPSDDRDRILASPPGLRSDRVRLTRPDGQVRIVDMTASAREIRGRRFATVVVHDVTEESTAAEAVLLSEQRFRALFESAPSGVVIIDSERKISDANSALGAMLGMPLAEMIGRSMVEFVAPGEPFMNAGRMTAMAKGERDYIQFDRKLARADGSTFWTRLTTSAVRDEEGNFLHTVRMVEDISDLMDAHEQLRTSELRQRDLFEAAPIGITFSNAERVVLDANPALATMFGVPIEEIIGNRLRKFAAPSWESPAVRPFDRMLDGSAERGSIDRAYIRASGETMWARMTASAVRNGQGEFLYAILTVEDITDQRAAEQDLVASREQLALTNARNESILGSAGEGIVAFDADGLIASVNPAAMSMMGVSAEEAVGSKPMDLVPPIRPEGTAYAEEESVLKMVLRDGVTRSKIGEKLERRDGTTIVIDRVVTAIFDNSKTQVIGGVITMRDVSDRAEMEKTKAEFFAATSHELRTPLTAIHASIGLVASGALGDLPAKAARQIDIAAANSDRLIALVNDILTLEQLGLGKVDLEKVETPIDGLLTNAAELVAPIATPSQIDITVDAPSDVVSCDAARITQVMTNLLGNAIKYSPADSTINVTAVAGDRVMTIAVSDPGPGIPPESIPTLFEEFQRVDSVANREQQGTGLGLAIAKAIVERHGGRIWVDSTLGQGSTFNFTLPLR
jgi:two-component system sensor histidine kinase VicK